MKSSLFRILSASLLVLAMALPMFACTDKEPAEDTEPDTTADVTAEQTAPETNAETETETEAETEPAKPLPTEVSLPEAYSTADIEYVCDDGSILYTFNGKTAEDYNAACTYYTGKDFRVYSSINQGENQATTFVGQSVMAHIYYHPSNGELNIVLSDTAADTLPPAIPEVTDGAYACTIVQIQDAANVNGMSYIIQLKDGSYIVYDGSYEGQYTKLKTYIQKNHKSDGLPVIRAWVLTHSHNDHYPTFQRFCEIYARKPFATVEHVIFSPLNEQNYPLNDENNDPYFSTTLYDDVAGLGAKLVFAHTGMDFKFCNLNMEILYAPESYYKTTDQIGNFNNTSIVSRLYDEDYSALFLADVASQGSTIMENLYGDYLKSDICQISHHGVEDVPLSFYEKVQASILYYPCNLWLYDQTTRHWKVRRAMETWDCTKEILIAGLGQYVRAWGTTFDADAPLSMPDYVPPVIEEETALPEGTALLATDKTTYAIGEPILVTAFGNGGDWVGISHLEAGGSLRWWYVTSVGSGTPFDLLSVVSDNDQSGNIPAGTYEIRLIPDNQGWVGTVSASITITITP